MSRLEQLHLAEKAVNAPADMEDLHDGDGKGTPIYANFKYEECSDGKTIASHITE